MDEHERQFSADLDVKGGAQQPVKTIIIASTPRSGSHMLGHAMSATGAMGVPFEYCQGSNLNRWSKMMAKSDPREVLRSIMARRTSRNGVFSIKLHPRQLRHIGGFQAALEFFPNPYFVKIYRSNLLKQAVSMSLAQQTGVWISGQESNGNTPEYSHESIARNLEKLAVMVDEWDRHISEAGLPSIGFEYQEVARSTPAVLARIAEHCGIEDYAHVESPPTKKQGGQQNADWAARFAAGVKEVSVFDRIRRRLPT